MTYDTHTPRAADAEPRPRPVRRGDRDDRATPVTPMKAATPTTPTTFCPSCGFTAGFNARFCPNCATPLVVPGSDPLLTRVRHAVAHDFEVLREIGRGGMAAVFLARELTPRRMVALKVMLPELAYSESMPQRFLAEVQTAAMLEHPNIVTIFRSGEDGGIRYFAMRYIDGASLEQLLQAGGRLPVGLACYVLAEMARALDFAHGEGVVHRDVKPGNVMLDRRWGRAIVTDFGIAKVAEAEHLTRTGLTIGTPSYMSPELCRGFAPTSASDQYALGVVAYQLLTGAPTFVGTALDVQNAHISDAPRPLRERCPECPPSLEAAVMRMLAKRPEDRWPRLAEALPALLEHVGGEAARQEELRARLLRLGHGGDGPAHDRRTHDRRSADGDTPSPAAPFLVAPFLATPAGTGPVPAPEPVRPAPAASVDVLPRLVHLAPGQSATVRALALNAEGYVVDGHAFEWSVSDPSVAGVDQQGVVRATAPGLVLVRARCGQASGTAEVSVVRPGSAALPGEDGRAPDPASQAPSLDLTALHAPPRTPGPMPARVSAPVPVPVPVPVAVAVAAPTPARVAAVRVRASATAVHCDDRLELTAVPEDASGAPLPELAVTWRAVPAGAVELRPAGPTHATLKALREGGATVVATCWGTDGHVEITVLPRAVHAMRTVPDVIDLATGFTATLRVEASDAQGRPCDPGPLQWASGSPGVATVDGAGVVTAVAPGAGVVVARAGGRVAAEAAVHVYAAPVARLEFGVLRQPLRVGRRAHVPVRPLDAHGRELTGRSVRWSTTTPALVRAAADGELALLAPGVAEVVAECEGVRASTTLTIAPAPTRPRWLLPAAGAGAALGLTALVVALSSGEPPKRPDPAAKPGAIGGQAAGASVAAPPAAGPGAGAGTVRVDTAPPPAAGDTAAGAVGDSVHPSTPVPVSTRIALPVSAPRVGVLGAGDTATLTMAITYSDRRVLRLYGGSQVRWESSDPAVVSFDQGVARAGRTGRAMITAKYGPVTARRLIAVEPRPGLQTAGPAVAAAPRVEHPSVRDAEALADGFAARLQAGPYEEALPLSAHAPPASAQLRQQLVDWLQDRAGVGRPSVSRSGDVYLDAAGNVLVFRLTARRTGRKARDETKQVDLRAPVDHAGRWRFVDVVVTGVR